MNIAVCDDQAEELETVTELLRQWQAQRRCPLHFRTFRSAAQLLDAARRERFTLYLLDVMMPGMDGMAAARELRSFDGNPVIYMENSYTFNDEVIDQMIENELWTEESLEQAGGRETILAIPDSHSIVVYGILDGNLVIYGGTYYEDAQKQEVLDAINIMLQTTEIE